MIRHLLLLALLLSSLLTFAQSSKKSIGDKFLKENQQNLNISNLDIRDAQLVDMYQTKHNGVTHMFYNQTYNGISVYNAIINLNLSKEDKMLYCGNTFVEKLETKINSTKSLFKAQDAIKSTAIALGIDNPEDAKFLKKSTNGQMEFQETNFSQGKIRVKQIYFPYSEEDVRLAWEVSFHQKNSTDSWSSKIDAVSSKVLEMENRTLYCSHTPGKYHNHSDECESTNEVAKQSKFPTATQASSYNVYALPSESPIHGPQLLVVDPHYPAASPFGWHDIDGMEGPEYTITRGNNVHAYNDDNDDGQSAGDEPDGGVELLFDIPHDPTVEPEMNRDADVINLFYANNMIHDITYLMGFDEGSGNFQANNYGNGGVDSDFVVAHSLDGSGVNNANFSIVPDGFSGNMNMFKWEIPQSSLFSIVLPQELQMNYQNGAAGGGWGFDETYSDIDIEAELAPAYDNSLQNANNACSLIANPEEVEGKIAMIYRGRCEFGVKALNAQNAGAIAVIICNVPGAGNDPTSDGNDPISNGMGAGASGANVTIPVFALGFQDCNTIVATIQGGTPVVGKIKAVDKGGPREVSSGFDNGIIFHEYGHGISSRLVGGPGQVCMGSDEQMGEGWSDFFSLALTVEPDDLGEDARGIGNFVQGEDINGRGIRRFPYSTDMAVNPQTFKSIKATTAPHPLGEVWADMLWDIFWLYVDKYGYDSDWNNSESGNFKAFQLVLDGMKMVGCNPGFISGRDAIIAAEQANTNGDNQCMLWEAFARRGLGFFADGGSVNNRNDGKEDFLPLPECQKTIKIYKEMPALIEGNSEIDVTIIIANHKDDTVYDLTVSDEIPKGLRFVEGSANIDAAVIGDQVIFEYDSLMSQQRSTIRFKLQYDNSAVSTILFSNTVESNGEIGEWQRELVENQTNIFRINSNTIFPTYSGENCWFVQELDEDTEAIIRFDNIEVIGEMPVVRFWHRMNTEFARNGGFVEISTDGLLWQDVRDHFIRNGYECPLAFTTFAIPALQAFSGRSTSSSYLDSYIDLSDFNGETISLRFRFGTNIAGTANDEVFPPDAGWFIDDIDLIDLIRNETQACVTTISDQACTEAFFSILDPQMISSNNELDLESLTLKLYPNPAGEFLNVEFGNINADEANINIINVKGEVVFNEFKKLNRNFNTVQVNTTKLPTGIYFVQLQSASGIVTKKLIIE